MSTPNVRFRTKSGSTLDAHVDAFPDECPICHKAIMPEVVAAWWNRKLAQIVFFCPNTACEKVFISYYQVIERRGIYFTGISKPITPRNIAFKESIRNISPSYCMIFEQSHQAEELGLDLICGPGYRKALEFLIKDYLITTGLGTEEEIKGKFLTACINEHVEHERIRSMASRATWLGNDETHYLRTWEEKDINDLKALIMLTENYIDSEAIASKYESEIKEPKKKGSK